MFEVVCSSEKFIEVRKLKTNETFLYEGLIYVVFRNK